MKKRNSQKAITLIITVFLVTICFLEPVHAAEQSNQMPSTNQSLDATDAKKPSPRKVGYVFEEKYMWHTPWIVQFSPLVQPFQHWEHAETKRRLHNLLLVSKIYDKLTHLQPIHPASESDIELVHTKEYIQSIQMQSARMEGGFADEETTFSQYAYDIAALAVGGTITAVDSVMQKHVDSAYVLCRPPGHHASSNTGEGFCIFNNIAIAARHLLQKYPNDVKKIAIVDYDVHHGNGTQDIFYVNEKVLYISTHQYPYYPGSGTNDEKGKHNNILNIPLPAGTTSEEYLNAYEFVLKKIKEFKPEFILLSAGFDAHKDDPLAQLQLESKDFYNITKRTLELSKQYCDGKVVSILEGGYDLLALQESTEMHVKALIEFN